MFAAGVGVPGEGDSFPLEKSKCRGKPPFANLLQHISPHQYHTPCWDSLGLDQPREESPSSETHSNAVEGNAAPSQHLTAGLCFSWKAQPQKKKELEQSRVCSTPPPWPMSTLSRRQAEAAGGVFPAGPRAVPAGAVSPSMCHSPRYFHAAHTPSPSDFRRRCAAALRAGSAPGAARRLPRGKEGPYTLLRVPPARCSPR